MRRRGQEVILVSSGAIALGRRHLGLSAGRLKLEESQAAAAVGQIRLAHAYKELLDAHGITVAQILLTLGDTEQRRRYLNARGTLNTLLSLGAVPVINENDTVATAEIRYGDNDRLAARVAQMIGADCLVLAVGHRRPVHGESAARIRTPNSSPACSKSRPRSKPWRAAWAATWARAACRPRLPRQRSPSAAGCHLCISKGAAQHPLKRIEEGVRCTWFVPSSTPLAMRKQWIAGTLKPAGAITVDDGAVRALLSGKSLLPAGVTRAVGRFERGDTVSIIGPDGSEVARGICAYSDSDAARIIGRKSAEIEKVLGFRGRDEIVHRDDLVLLSVS